MCVLVSVLSRRAMLSTVAILAPQGRPSVTAANVPTLQYYGTPSGLIYFDTRITRDNVCPCAAMLLAGPSHHPCTVLVGL